jgi:hypothetical protein
MPLPFALQAMVAESRNRIHEVHLGVPSNAV